MMQREIGGGDASHIFLEQGPAQTMRKLRGRDTLAQPIKERVDALR
jgi:hypothetical protein